MRTIRWTKRALGRLDEISAFIAQDNPERGSSFAVELRAKVNVLVDHTPGRAGRVFGTRELVIHKNYIAVYRIVGDQVAIITLQHTAQLH